MIPPADKSAILVIDDEPDNLRLAVEMLRDHGLEMISARNGADGLRIAARLHPDLILLDIRMPGLDGFQVCRRLKADPATREIPVIFLTALDQFEDKARGFAVGGVDYVTKPFDARELLLRVINHLRLARRGAALADHPAAPDAPVSSRPMPQNRSLEILIQARDYLLADLAHPPDLATLARYCGTNRTSLQRLFQTHLGMSVFGYLREQRLQRARSLLAQGRQNIEAVAGTVGYQNGRDLARAFRQRFGVAPSALARSSFNPDPSAPHG